MTFKGLKSNHQEEYTWVGHEFLLMVKKAIQGGEGSTQQFGSILLISNCVGQGGGNILDPNHFKAKRFRLEIRGQFV